MAAIVVVLVGAAAGTTFAMRSSGGTAGLCATPPPGWKSQRVALVGPTPPALLLTNFRFGRHAYEWGLLDPKLRWGPGRITVAVVDWTGRNSSIAFAPSPLRVSRADLTRFEGFPHRVAHRFVRADGRQLEIWVEARPLRPADLAAANAALAGVRTCMA